MSTCTYFYIVWCWCGNSSSESSKITFSSVQWVPSDLKAVANCRTEWADLATLYISTGEDRASGAEHTVAKHAQFAQYFKLFPECLIRQVWINLMDLYWTFVDMSRVKVGWCSGYLGNSEFLCCTEHYLTGQFASSLQHAPHRAPLKHNTLLCTTTNHVCSPDFEISALFLIRFMKLDTKLVLQLGYT